MLYDNLFELNIKRKNNSKGVGNVDNQYLDEWLGGLGKLKNVYYS